MDNIAMNLTKPTIDSLFRIGVLVVSIFLSQPVLSADSDKLLITEIMAINGKTIADEDGDYSDWIEIYNPGESAIDMNNWSLTDDPLELDKWKFPTIILNPDTYLVVFASNKNKKFAKGQLHTNFKLSGSGEFLALVESDMKTISYSYGDMYPVQQEDISYGLINGIDVFLTSPTPGAANITGNQVIDPVFNHERGFYNDPFNVEINTPQEAIKIYYTTDGTLPTALNGRLYSAPITISTTTPLSAIVLNSNGETSSVITQTYLFVNDIVKQSNQPEGYPGVWSTSMYSKDRLPADYEMDPEICNNSAYKGLMDKALKAIPSLCIVTNKDNLFSLDNNPTTGGIYIYTGKSGDGSTGDGWERPTSVEFIDPSTGQNFQVNCGILLHGGNSRVPDNSQKHSLRLSFRSEYGVSKLKFNFFDDKRNPTNEFNSLVLRAGYNYSWTKNSSDQNKHADFLRDPFAKNTQLDMGNPSAHNRFVHLYINGLYWGVYNVSEKITNDFMESYMNGQAEDWDVVKDHYGTTDGTRNAWNSMISLAGSGLSQTAAYQKIQGNDTDGSPNANYPNYLDVENLIDYILYNFYIGNKDWDGNNWLAARNKVETKYGFRMFAWDAETSMLKVNEDIVEMNDGEPTKLFNYLKKNDDFKLLVADRIQKHFFNGGALSVEATTQRYQELVDEINLAIIGESARWGDYRRDVQNIGDGAELYTRNEHWLVEVENQRSNYLPYRSNIVFKQLQESGFFPETQAPIFSNYGGKLDNGIVLSMDNPNSSGQIYFTTNDVDPRVSGGGISTTASVYNNSLNIVGKGTIKARVKVGNDWSALTEAKFKSDNTDDFVTINREISTIQTSCYPNPVINLANITYELNSSGMVVINLVSIDGRLASQLFSGVQQQGTHQYNWDATDCPNGIYLYEISVNGRKTIGKIIVQK